MKGEEASAAKFASNALRLKFVNKDFTLYIPHHIAKTSIFEYCPTVGLKISGNLELETLSVSQASVHSVKSVSQEGSGNIREVIDSQDGDEVLPENRTEPVNPSVPTRPEIEQTNLSSRSIPPFTQEIEFARPLQASLTFNDLSALATAQDSNFLNHTVDQEVNRDRSHTQKESSSLRSSPPSAAPTNQSLKLDLSSLAEIFERFQSDIKINLKNIWPSDKRTDPRVIQKCIEILRRAKATNAFTSDRRLIQVF